MIGATQDGLTPATTSRSMLALPLLQWQSLHPSYLYHHRRQSAYRQYYHLCHSIRNTSGLICRWSNVTPATVKCANVAMYHWCLSFDLGYDYTARCSTYTYEKPNYHYQLQCCTHYSRIGIPFFNFKSRYASAKGKKKYHSFQRKSHHQSQFKHGTPPLLCYLTQNKKFRQMQMKGLCYS